MNLNEVFFHEALRKLNIGITIDEFAEAYADASKEDRNNSIWQNLFEEGKEVFRNNLDVVSADNKIGEDEFNMFQYVINYLKNLPSRFNESLYLPQYKGNTTNDLINKKSETVNEDIEAVSEKYLEQEVKNLKPVEIMSREEHIAELKLYYPDKNFDDMSDDEIIGKLNLARQYVINNDKGSNEIDYHIGTFAQGAQGNCGPLSQIAKLTDAELRNLVKEMEDENGNYYIVTLPMDINNPEHAIKIYENEVMSGLLNIDGLDDPVSGFSTGDADARLFEMAYVKRFGTKEIEDGESAGKVQNIFSYPDEPLITYADGEITEEKLMQANNGRLTAGLTYWDMENESMSYLDTYTDPVSGITARYVPLRKLEFLKEDFKARFPKVREELYKDLNESEFLEFSLYFTCANTVDRQELTKLPPNEIKNYLKQHSEFVPRCKVELSNGDYFIDGHAYTVKSYNPETKEVILVEPHTTNVEHVVPLEIAKMFFRISK